MPLLKPETAAISASVTSVAIDVTFNDTDSDGTIVHYYSGYRDGCQQWLH